MPQGYSYADIIRRLREKRASRMAELSMRNPYIGTSGEIPYGAGQLLTGIGELIHGGKEQAKIREYEDILKAQADRQREAERFLLDETRKGQIRDDVQQLFGQGMEGQAIEKYGPDTLEWAGLSVGREPTLDDLAAEPLQSMVSTEGAGQQDVFGLAGQSVQDPYAGMRLETVAEQQEDQISKLPEGLQGMFAVDAERLATTENLADFQNRMNQASLADWYSRKQGSSGGLSTKDMWGFYNNAQQRAQAAMAELNKMSVSGWNAKSTADSVAFIARAQGQISLYNQAVKDVQRLSGDLNTTGDFVPESFKPFTVDDFMRGVSNPQDPQKWSNVSAFFSGVGKMGRRALDVLSRAPGLPLGPMQSKEDVFRALEGRPAAPDSAAEAPGRKKTTEEAAAQLPPPTPGIGIDEYVDRVLISNPWLKKRKDKDLIIAKAWLKKRKDK